MKETLKFIAACIIFSIAGIAIGCGLIIYAEWRDETERAGRSDCTQVDERTRLCGQPEHYWRRGK